MSEDDEPEGRRVDTVTDEPVKDASRNELLLYLTPAELVVEMRLHINDQIDIQTKENACFTIEVDPARKPLP